MSPFNAIVDRIVDGDTLVVRVAIRTRSSTPSGRTPEGVRATAALAKEFPLGTRVLVQPIVTDQFGRIVGTIDKQPDPRHF